MGRRKKSVARVFIKQSRIENIMINKKDISEYFKVLSCRIKVMQPIIAAGLSNKLLVYATVKGGGYTGQAEAIRSGITNALLLLDTDTRSKLKEGGFVTRDARVKERKKVGRKKARKKAQFSKR
ncbi:30S ribosomal protein S9 [Vibrio parahaemolyticus]|uniref:30S ribosomal protein S9 n=1 Tax=Vibrio parahaemolyticus TaxID=670 RepID=UPI00235F4753|nr:30S ribosomal protein S9 [Vibrio parahaemolyticus]